MQFVEFLDTFWSIGKNVGPKQNLFGNCTNRQCSITALLALVVQNSFGTMRWQTYSGRTHRFTYCEQRRVSLVVPQ
ncbi:hypothetical protein JRQ81_005875, partial [Phrynocephalus forsythii]